LGVQKNYWRCREKRPCISWVLYPTEDKNNTIAFHLGFLFLPIYRYPSCIGFLLRFLLHAVLFLTSPCRCLVFFATLIQLPTVVIKKVAAIGRNEKLDSPSPCCCGRLQNCHWFPSWWHHNHDNTGCYERESTLWTLKK